MARSSFVFTVLTAAPLLAACGSDVVVDTSAGTSTGTGGAASTTTTATATGTGGATTTTTTGTGAATTTSTGTGGSPAICGGKQGAPCPPDQWCDFPPDALCGGFDSTGVCMPQPMDCFPDDCPGVCGCDGSFYCNACLANQAGTDASTNLGCIDMGDSYKALSLFTGVPRYAILKSSPSRNLCFRLVIEPNGSSGIGIFGGGWAVGSAEVTSDVSDCDFPPGWPPMAIGASFMSMSGGGMLSYSQQPGGCVVGIHAKVDFTGAPPWAAPWEPFDADGMVIDPGCP